MSCTSKVFLALAMLFSYFQVACATTVSIGAAMDNTMFASAAGDRSNGVGQNFFAGTNAVSLEARRGLISFDVAGSLPAGADINSVTLKLRMSRTISGAQDASLHRITQSWGEGLSNASGQEGMGASATAGDATWTHALWPGTPWTTPGGDFVAAPSASRLVAGIGTYDWGSTPLMIADVQNWLDNPIANFGWLLLVDESAAGTAKRFDSREHPTRANRPLLTIEYTPVPEPTMIATTLWIAMAIVSLSRRRLRR